MKNTFIVSLLGLAFSLGLVRADYATNTITTPGGSYAFSVNGSPANNPTIDLVAGVTNILIIDTASFHPVVVSTQPDTFDWYDAAAPQNTYAGNMELTTPTTGFPTVLYYVCYYHGFYGEIHITAPLSPMPPANTILQVQVGSQVVMTSTGTNTIWKLVPEFSSNLVNGAWADVPSYTNTYANGTNTTIFPRLDPICGPNVFLRLRQQSN